MPLYRDGEFIEDLWISLDDTAPLPADGPLIVSLARWRSERAVFDAWESPLGVRIEAGSDIADVMSALDRFAQIALVFPKFSDGRAFSMARLLRERHAYAGQLRAVGDVLFDEIALMQRCGFDLFEIHDARTVRALERVQRPCITHFYQPGLGRLEIPAGTRPWARRAG